MIKQFRNFATFKGSFFLILTDSTNYQISFSLVFYKSETKEFFCKLLKHLCEGNYQSINCMDFAKNSGIIDLEGYNLLLIDTQNVSKITPISLNNYESVLNRNPIKVSIGQIKSKTVYTNSLPVFIGSKPLELIFLPDQQNFLKKIRELPIPSLPFSKNIEKRLLFEKIFSNLNVIKGWILAMDTSLIDSISKSASTITTFFQPKSVDVMVEWILNSVRRCVNSSVVVGARESRNSSSSSSKGSLDLPKLYPSYTLFSKARGIGTGQFRQQFDLRMQRLSIDRYSWVRKKSG